MYPNWLTLRRRTRIGHYILYYISDTDTALTLLQNTFKDVGNFQFFGSVIDTDVVENVGERMGGFFR